MPSTFSNAFTENLRKKRDTANLAEQLKSVAQPVSSVEEAPSSFPQIVNAITAPKDLKSSLDLTG